MRKVVLDLESCASLQDSVRLPNSSGEHMTLLPGYGDVDFRFPDVKTIVNKALARLAGAGTGRDKDEDTTDGANGTKAPEETGGKPSESQPPADDDGDDSSPESAPEADDDGEAAMHGPRSRRVPLIRHRVSLNGQKGLPRFPVDTLVAPKQLLSALPDDLENMDGTLFLAAGGLALIMDEGKYDAIVAERFDPLAGAVNWALSHMEESYQPAILSLKKQLDKLQVLYKTALPRVLAVLEGQNPDVDQRVLEQAAVEALDEQLVQILTVLRIWTDAFAQRRDGMYPQLEAITYVVNEAFKLQTQSDKCKGKINTVVFQVGSVFVARYSNEGPATLPGTRGPIKAHAIECNHSQRKCSSLVLVLYLHEFRHNIFADIEGLAKEVILTTVVGKLREAYDQGQIKLSSDKITFAGNELNMIDVITKILVDNTPEIDADLAGGVLLSGWAYALNMVMTFSALNVGHDGVLRAGPMLRSGSYYRLKKSKGQVALSFLPHPPDYIRAYIVAAALDEIGFPAEAQKCRRLADQAAGSPLPKFIVWKDLSGKSKESIKILVDDLKQVAPVVAKAMIRTPLQALGGQCMFDILNWNKHRQGKVDILKEILMKGGSDLPTDIGDIYGTYVAAAATLAYWGLLEKGVRPVVAAASVEENMLKMMFALRDRQKKFEAENPNHDACEGEADKDAAPSSGTTGGAAAGDAKPAKPVKKKTAGKKTKPKPAKKKQS